MNQIERRNWIYWNLNRSNVSTVFINCMERVTEPKQPKKKQQQTMQNKLLCIPISDDNDLLFFSPIHYNVHLAHTNHSFKRNFVAVFISNYSQLYTLSFSHRQTRTLFSYSSDVFLSTYYRNSISLKIKHIHKHTHTSIETYCESK